LQKRVRVTLDAMALGVGVIVGKEFQTVNGDQ
jgi:hypothetical protein